MKQIVLYSDDINLLMHWEKAFTQNSYIIYEDIKALKEITNSLIVLNYEACEQNCEDFLSTLINNNNNILLLERVPELSKAKRLLKIGIKGYGNAMMREHFLCSALYALEEGMIWLHPELTSALILELPSNPNKEKDQVIMLAKLTQREKEVALLLKDALTYNSIAESLNISPRTVKAHAQSIYTKLDVKDRLGLALLLK